MRAFKSLVLPLALLVSGACYNYAPVQGPPPVGSDVRAVLTAEQALDLSDRTGQVSRSYDGRLLGATDDSLSISVVTARSSSEFTGSQTLRQTLTFPLTGVEELSERELSTTKTLAVAVIAGAAAAAALNSVIETGGTTGDGGGGEPTGGFLPIFRIFVGR